MKHSVRPTALSLITAMPLMLVLVLAIAALASCRLASAQDEDIFGAAPAEDTNIAEGGATATATGPSVSGQARPSEQNAVVRSLRSNPPKSAVELAKAVQLMSRIRRWEEVGHWLDQLIPLGSNQATATQVVQSIGSQVFLELLNPEVADITDKQRQAVRGILEMARASALDVKKLRANVLTLKSDNKSERVNAFRSLQFAGGRGAAALMEHLLSEQADAPNATMSEAFMLMGANAFGAWKAAITTQDATARGRLALLAARIGEPSLTITLCSAANDDRLPPSVQQELKRIASSKGKSIPSAELVHRYGVDELQKSLRQFQSNRWSDEADAFVTWRLSSDGRSLVETPARIADLHWQSAVQFAHATLQASHTSNNYSALAVVVLMEDAYRASSMSDPSSTSTSLETIASSLPKNLWDTYEFAGLLWDTSVREDLSSAQLQSVQNLGRWASSNDIPILVRERLVTALSSGHPAVRYQAASILVDSMYERATPSGEDAEVAIESMFERKLVNASYDGRNRLERVLAEMRKLDPKPLALVIGGSSNLRTQVATLLEAFSFRVTEASSSSQTMSLIKEGTPIEGVILVDRVRDMSIGQLAERIRANATTSACPIAVLADSLSNGEHILLGGDPKVIMGSVPPEELALADILRRMKVITQSPTVDSTSRIAWQNIASDYWTDLNKQFVSSHGAKKTKPTAETAVAQTRLLTIVSDKSTPLPDREQASQTFVQSIKQFGLQISTETQNAQYDVYNARGADEKDLRVMLGRMLDAIEAAEGKRTWAEVAP
jgi:CheY-like chemotaxis protein